MAEFMNSGAIPRRAPLRIDVRSALEAGEIGRGGSWFGRSSDRESSDTSTRTRSGGVGVTWPRRLGASRRSGFNWRRQMIEAL